ncbi:MAG: hypothetical protein DHS20C01_13500 [marine bacterium B5-7]|nr:MAG: hypothetical protein DHS20C01_13500 [marine bacterium B5-7]
MAQNLIDVGTVDFEGSTWASTYFNSEMPAQWRFLYYSNQFRSVLLPLDKTDFLLSPQGREITDDSDTGFHFILTISWQAANSDQTLLQRLESLDIHIAALVIEISTCCEPTQDANLEQLAIRWPVCLDVINGSVDEPASIEVLKLAEKFDATLLWRPDISSTIRLEPLQQPYEGGRYLITRISAPTLPQLRSIIESLALWKDGYRSAGIFFDDNAKAPQNASDCRILVELMNK